MPLRHRMPADDSVKLFITGTVGMIGSDDVLSCFVAGNVFTWDDWFRLETKDDSLQPTIDMLLNVSVFMWYGAVCPDRKSTRLNSSHSGESRMPSSA